MANGPESLLSPLMQCRKCVHGVNPIIGPTQGHPDPAWSPPHRAAVPPEWHVTRKMLVARSHACTHAYIHMHIPVPVGHWKGKKVSMHDLSVPQHF